MVLLTINIHRAEASVLVASAWVVPFPTVAAAAPRVCLRIYTPAFLRSAFDSVIALVRCIVSALR